MARSGLPALDPVSLGTALRRRRIGARWTIALVVAGPIFAGLTAFVLSEASTGAMTPEAVRIVLLADLVYILAVAALIVWTIGKAVAARRRRSAGAKLHLRLSGLFTLVALIPTILVAVFATLTVNFGMEAWFSNSVGDVVRNALATAEAYEDEHKRTIRGDALAMANDLTRATSVGADQNQLAQVLRQQQLLRELPEAFILNGDAQIVARGEFSYLFTLDPPTPQQFAAARAGDVVVIDDETNNELRALVHMSSLLDRFLYITRRIEGDVLLLLDETRETVRLYERLESERNRVLFDFALLYLGFALLVIMAAVWLGLWFAESLSRPIGRLAGAAERVGEGDFDHRVKVRGDDEIATLSDLFNRMTGQLKRQRDALVAGAEETERRRRFIETVLSGVSAGVIGLDATGRIELVNASARVMLGATARKAEGRDLGALSSQFADLLDAARSAPSRAAQDQIRLDIAGAQREFRVRVTPKGADSAEGWVLTLDDMTELVAAQRMAAWGDVARRVAHEIKNPLTPIQLSAERLKHKFRRLAEDDQAALGQYADVIIRQAGDIRRMVDEFSRFARMPAPEAHPEDLREVVDSAVLLQKSAGEDVAFTLETPEAPVCAQIDRGLFSQALTNLLKNATEAVAARRADRPEPPGEIRVGVAVRNGAAEIAVSDNGIGLPQDRARLTEPYVTTRAKGTGLGLAIVKKVVEEHGGSLALEDAEPFAPGAPAGARLVIRLPLAADQPDAPLTRAPTETNPADGDAPSAPLSVEAR
jgi:two-component system nitrogen regulation sensor histidine kinase NtrY